MLKIHEVGSDPGSTDCLVSVLDHLAEQDPALPVPRLFPTLRGEASGRFSRDGIDYATCLVSFLPGRLLAQASPTPALLHDMGATLARLDRALQGFFHPSLRRRLAWDVRRLPELAEHFGYIRISGASRTDHDGVSAPFGPACLGCAACAARPFMATVMPPICWWMPAGESICGILDFGDMIHAPLIFEPAVAMSELLTEAVAPLPAVAAVLQGYAQRRASPAAEVELLYDIVAARHAVTLLVHAWRRRHDPPGAQVLDDAAVRAQSSRCITC